ncbi:hypothetical protein Goari_006119 [Gossypium aridum]|uniref:Endonuclease/exonuclease/phosphatase domain-containing protein n=1 Tax=Gossypium aridum TaxID=34290 RepID=A0A7J8XML3_GOSAI|nr:hypothetical protein [Gossypium aridum]
MIFFMETKICKNQMERIRYSCGFVNGIEVDPEERFSWFVCGDFNEILYGYENTAGVPRDERRMELFRNVLTDCNLVDVGFSRRWFTWEKGNLPETNIR